MLRNSPSSLGTVLRQYRETVLQMTGDTFGREIGVTGSLISSIEQGGRMTNKTLRRIGERFPELHARLVPLRLAELCDEIGVAAEDGSPPMPARYASMVRQVMEALMKIEQARSIMNEELHRDTMKALEALVEIAPRAAAKKKTRRRKKG